MLRGMPIPTTSSSLTPAFHFIFVAFASAHSPAGMFAVLQQCKIVTTAVLSRLMLSRHLSWSKWRALLLLLAGVVLITHEEHALRAAGLAAAAAAVAPPSPPAVAMLALGQTHAPPEAAATAASGTHVGTQSSGLERGQGSLVLGVSAVLLETALSGFATVYFERVVKSTPLSIWHRNVQLAGWSLSIFVPMALHDSPRPGAPLANWSWLEVANSGIGAAGGILVALCIVRFDSIIKSIAVAASIVLTAVSSFLCLGGPMTLPIAIASAVVIIATVNYSFSP